MRALAMIIRIFSYLYHSVLGVFLFGIAFLAWQSGQELKMPQAPWSGDALTHWLMISSVIGLLTVVLAISGKVRFLFTLWALAVVVMMFRGYILGPYSFSGAAEFRTALYLIVGALIALIGAFLQLRQSSSRT